MKFCLLFLRLQAKFHIAQELIGKLHATAAGDLKSEALNMLLKDLNDKTQKARDTMNKMFNESFGATFLANTCQESCFA